MYFAMLGEASYSIPAFLILIAVIIALTYASPAPWLRRVDTFCGDLTYPLYLIHIPLLAILLRRETEGGLGKFVFVSVSCFGAAYLLHLLIERPLIRLREKIRHVASPN